MKNESGIVGKWLIIFSSLVFTSRLSVLAQSQWPRTMEGKNGGKVVLYQPQPEKLEGNVVTGRVAISVRQKSEDDPVFGALWFNAVMETNRDSRMAILQSIKIKDIRLPGIEDTAKIAKLRNYLELEIPKWKLQATLDDILASIEREKSVASENLKNDPPAIVYNSTPSILVMIDGEPKLEQDEKLRMKRVINTAFLIFQYPKDNQFYLYGGNTWYSAPSITSGWKPVKKLPKDLQDLDRQIKEQQQKENPTKSSPAENAVPEVVVATKPTELIQSDGEANFSNIADTKLLYVTNSEDHIFMDINTNRYFVLISGRWYTSSSLSGTWTYTASDQLPADFSKIPKGSEKDIVLASVAGTDEAEDAIMDAQIPQTAKVDRKTATCTVKYDGEPKFEKIEGTSLYLAQNTSSTVIRSGDNYFCVENGVWFKAAKPDGPWKVSDDRPKDVDKIPASSEAYNTKYVYIYDSSPEYVYVGYTPGYMGCYVYGPTVVYGTGYYYNPWYGPYYYPRPATYGFSMNYNPWTGWSMGFHYSNGFFNFNAYFGGGYGGYWGCPGYRPPYYPAYHGGVYGGRGPVYVNGDVNIDRSNNIYNNRNGISSGDINRPSQLPARNNGNVNRPTNQPSGDGSRNRPSNLPANTGGGNNVVTDRQGNVYQRSENGSWQQRDGNNWKAAENASTNDLNRQMQNRERSQNLNNNFNQTNRGGNLGGNYSRPAAGRGGGMRRR